MAGPNDLRNSMFFIIGFFAMLLPAIGSVNITLIPPDPVIRKTTESTLVIDCKIDGIPDGALEEQRPRWLKIKDNKEEEIGNSGRVRILKNRENLASLKLILQNLMIDDACIYKCVYGKEETSVNLTISRKVTFVDTPSEHHPLAGQNTEIKCRIKADDEVQIIWTKDGVSIGEEDDRYSFKGTDLSIIKYDPAFDDGVYKCEACQTSAGDCFSTLISVTGYVPPDSVIIEVVDNDKWNKGIHEDATNVMLTCSANGVPVPELKWYKGDTDLSVDSRYNIPRRGVLEIKKMTQNEAGMYYCEATNAVGVKKNETNLDVFVKPRITLFQTNRSVLFGEDFSSECTFNGGEPLTGSWIRNGMKITERYDNELDQESLMEASGDGEKQNDKYVITKKNTAVVHVVSAALTDAGEYICNVSNDAGSASETLRLEVQKPPTLTSHSIGKIRAVIGIQFSIFCEVLAVPDPEWKWTKQGADIVHQDGHFEIKTDGRNSSLTVVPINDDDFGSYMCTANNNIGKPASTPIEVIKIEEPEKPDVYCDEAGSKPTSIRLKILTFSSQSEHPENKRPNQVEIRVNDGDIPTPSQTFAHDGLYSLANLEPDTQYLLNVSGVNEAGTSETTVVECRTSVATVPGKPIFVPDANEIQCSVAECPIEWRLEDSGGKPVTGYSIEYKPQNEEGMPVPTSFHYTISDSRYVLTNLISAAKYIVTVRAMNAVGTGEAAEIIVAAPDESRQVGGETLDQYTTGPSTGAIVGIVIIILLIIVVLIDVACYYVNQCGLLMCICVNLCGKAPAGEKSKEAMAEEGDIVIAKETKFEEKREKQVFKEGHSPASVEKPDVDANESTPMIETQVHQELKTESRIAV